MFSHGCFMCTHGHPHISSHGPLETSSHLAVHIHVSPILTRLCCGRTSFFRCEREEGEEGGEGERGYFQSETVLKPPWCHHIDTHQHGSGASLIAGVVSRERLVAGAVALTVCPRKNVCLLWSNWLPLCRAKSFQR